MPRYRVPLRYTTRRRSVQAIQFDGINEADCAEFAGKDFKCRFGDYLVKFGSGVVVALPEETFNDIFEIAT